MRQERDLHPQIEARVRESFARQNAMATIGAKLGNVRAGEVEIVIPSIRASPSSTASCMPASPP